MISPLLDLTGMLRRLDGPWRDVAPEIADACAVLGLPFTLRTILLCLRDMPYRRPAQGNSVTTSLEEWRGTCSAKHLAVHDLMCRLEFAPKLWMARYLIHPNFPGCDAALREALRRSPVYDIHNYVTCDLGRGDILIDVTFPRALEPHGFIVTQDWTGDGDFRLACAPLEVREIAVPSDALSAKRDWLGTVNPGRAGELREQVIMAIFTLMDRTVPPPDRRAAVDDTLRTLLDNRLGGS